MEGAKPNTKEFNLPSSTSESLTGRTADERRARGIYYTPQNLAQAVASWAIREPHQTILEPSFGGCGFLAAACERLYRLGCKHPALRTAGCDLDELAFAALPTTLCRDLPDGHILKRDFLAVSLNDFAIGPFDCVLGNPPFVRHHQIERSVKEAIRRGHGGGPLELSRTAGLWAYFVVHGLRFLKPRGRLGLVLPGSFLFADYAAPLQRLLRSKFQRLVIVRLNYRAFQAEGAEERAVILLADGFAHGPSASWDEFVASNEAEAVATIQSLSFEPVQNAKSCGAAQQPTESAYDRLSRNSMVVSLGAIAKIDIGVVTGANRFFVVGRETVDHYGLPRKTLQRIVSRTSQLRGLRFAKADHKTALNEGAACWLFAPSELGPRHGTIRDYLATVPRGRRRSTAWFKKRARWYQPEAGDMPDATLTYMNHHGPRIVLLDRSTTCTNTLHRLWFDPKSTVMPELIALSFLTSFSQLSAEREGRFYGGGILKLEPKGARRIRLVIPKEIPKAELAAAFAAADSALRDGRLDQAMKIADETILRPILGRSFSDTRAEVVRQLAAARHLRHGR